MPVGSPALASAIPSSSSNARLVAGGGGSASARRRKTAADSGAPLPCRRTRGIDQPLDDPGVAAGSLDEQMLGDALVRARPLGEQPCGAAVALRALRADSSE